MSEEPIAHSEPIPDPPPVEIPVPEDSRWVKIDRALILLDQRTDQILGEERTTAQIMVITTAVVLCVMAALVVMRRDLVKLAALVEELKP